MFTMLRWKTRWLLPLGALLGLTLIALLALTPPLALGQGEPEEVLYARIPAHAEGDQSGTPDQGVAENMEIVGRHDLGGRGFNADVWVHNQVAYVGQWGFGDPQHPERCPSGAKSGVKVLDVSDPAHPRLIATLQNPPQTTAEDVQVLRYTSGRFKDRDIALVGIQACFRTNLAIPRGLQLFDVTDPAHPQEIGFLNTGPATGVHEFWAVQRADGVFAILAVPFSMLRDDRTPPRGDVRIVDVSDPTRPREIADWSSEQELGQGTFDGFGCFPFVFAHGAFTDRAGMRAFVAHWDLGTVILDIADPGSPVFLGHTGYAAEAEGDGHSVDMTQDERFLLQADEVIPPNSNCQAPDRHTEKGWGYLRVFDLANLSSPPQVGQFKTDHAASPNRPRKGDYSIHNPLVVGDKAYLSWYSDGVRVVDISNPATPVEQAFLVPPAAKDPLRVLPFAPEVWGVVADERSCVYLSEMNFGLYVVRETGASACQ